MHDFSNEVKEDAPLAATGKLRIFSMTALHDASSKLDEKLILGTCATILLNWLKENRYFGNKLSTSIV